MIMTFLMSWRLGTWDSACSADRHTSGPGRKRQEHSSFPGADFKLVFTVSDGMYEFGLMKLPVAEKPFRRQEHDERRRNRTSRRGKRLPGTRVQLEAEALSHRARRKDRQAISQG
jgi:hypothetical protein